MPAFIINVWTWFTNNKWAQYLLLGILIVLGVREMKNRWQSNIEKGVRRIEREKYQREQAEAQAAAVTTISENSREYISASERVRSHDVAVQLPNERGARLPDENYRD